MTKKEKILNAALELFANEGFNATATSKIADRAEVSEGLIFRHFKNKKSLLAEIMADAEQRLLNLIAPILNENDPDKVLKHTIELPFKVDRSEYDYWKLQFKLKWDPLYNNPKKITPFLEKLTVAFEELDYEYPRFEAQLLNQVIDAISIEILQENLKNTAQYEIFLKNRYQV